jgi:hypothetical protein
MPTIRTIIAFLVAPATFALAGNAAAATYELELNGQAQYFPLCFWDIPDCTGGSPPPVYYDWRGTVELGIDPPGPSGEPTPVSISLTANGGSFSYSKELGYLLSSGVTIVNGRVTSIDARLPSPYSDSYDLSFHDLSVVIVDPGSHHHGGTTYTGTLTAVPEPGDLASMLAGLASIAGLGGLRRRLRHPLPATDSSIA